MLNGRLEIRHTFLGETNFVIIRWFKTSAPLTQASGMVNGITVTQVVYPSPHSEESLLIENLDGVMYDVKSYRSTDGINIDSQIFTLAADAGARSTYSSTTYTYIVDRGESGTDPDWADPVAGVIELRDERLLNESYSVFERGTGQLIPPEESSPEYIDRSDAGGGFDFTITDKVFESGATYFVTVQNRVDADSGSGSGSGSEVSDIFIIDADQDFDAGTMNQKLLFADYSTSGIGVLSFPNLVLISDCSFKVSTHGGNQSFLQLQLDAGDTVRFMSEDKKVITLGKSEEISIMIRNNVMYVLNDGTNYKRLGQRIWGDKVELNTVTRDGTLYLQANQPRLMEFIETLPAAQVVTEAQWASSQSINYIVPEVGTATTKTIFPYKSMFARDDIGGTIRVPDDREMIIKGYAAAQTGRPIDKPGGRQVEDIGEHYHGLPIREDNTAFGFGGVALTVASHAYEDIAASATTTVIHRSAKAGSKTTPENTGLIPLIII